jgi:hypothetical protein
MQGHPAPIVSVPSAMISSGRQQPLQGKTLLPSPEELPPLPYGKDTLVALLWAGSILLSIVSIVLIAR